MYVSVKLFFFIYNLYFAFDLSIIQLQNYEILLRSAWTWKHVKY